MKSHSYFTTYLLALFGLCSCAPSEMLVHATVAAAHVPEPTNDQGSPAHGWSPEIVLFEAEHEREKKRREDALNMKREGALDITTPLQCPHPDRPSPEHLSYCLVDVDADSYRYQRFKQYDVHGRLVLDRDTRGERIEIAYDGPYYSERRRVYKRRHHDQEIVLESERFIFRDALNRFVGEELLNVELVDKNLIAPAVIAHQITYDERGRVSSGSWSTYTPPPCSHTATCGMNHTMFFMDRVQKDGSIVRMASYDKNQNGLLDDGNWVEASKYRSYSRIREVSRSEPTDAVCEDEPDRSKYKRYEFEYDSKGSIANISRYEYDKLLMTATVEHRCDGFVLKAKHARGEKKPLATIRYRGGACHLTRSTVEEALDQFFVKTLLRGSG